MIAWIALVAMPIATAQDANDDGCVDSFEGNGACVALSASVHPSSTIGANVHVHDGAQIGNDVMVGADTVIGARASVGGRVDYPGIIPLGERVIIGRRAVIGTDHELADETFLGRAVQAGNDFVTGAGASVGFGTDIGNNVTLGANAIVGSLVTLGDHTSVQNGAILARGVTIASAASPTEGSVIDGILGPNVTVGTGADIADGARIRKGATLGNDVEVAATARIGRDAMIGEGATVLGRVSALAMVGEGATVSTDAVVLRGAEVCAGATVPSITVSELYPLDGCFVGIENVGGVRQWEDGSFASACWDYRNPTGDRAYDGDVGSGAYRVDPQQNGTGFTVYCDMDFEGGGWTLVDNDPTTGGSFGSRTVGALTDVSQTGGRRLPAYEWSNDPLLLCRSSRFTGSVGWLTLEAGGTIARQYPTAVTQSSSHDAGWAVRELNGNSNQGLTSWIYNGSGRFGSVWIGNGSNSTCSCNYVGSETGLGTWGSANNSTCSTWVR